MQRALFRFFLVLALMAGIAACAVVAPSPYAHGVLQPGFNRSWNNAIDAMKDEGVQVVMSDLAAGRLEGQRGRVTLTVRVVNEGVGKQDVDFVASGAVAEDPTLADRVRKRFDARMAQ